MDREPKDVEAALAHDLNNYLQVVMGNLEVLRRRSSFVPEVVGAALNATRHAAQLADRLVTIARLRNLEPRALDLDHALTDLRDMLARTLGEAVRVEMQLGAGGKKVVVDPRCLQIALLELATNSREAMPGGGEFRLRTHADGAGVRLEVADTGGGMAREKLACAFQPLFAGEGPKPTALGLHIVERCVREAGGRVEIASEAARGTIVTLHLPTA